MTSEQQEWGEFRNLVAVTSIDQDVEDELAGKSPPGGIGSWNAHWIDVISTLEKNYIGNQKYIDYIILSREKAGLPPLVRE